MVCGQDIPKDKMIDDAVMITGITEDGEWWKGFAFICTLDCFLKFKERLFKDKQGTELVFHIN